MKKLITLLMLGVAISVNAQIKVTSTGMTIIGKIIPGVTYPNISKDSNGDYYLVHVTKCTTDNRQVIKLGNKETAIGTLNYFKEFIEENESGASVDIEDESTGKKYRLYRESMIGQGGIKIEEQDEKKCASDIYIKSIKKAIKIVEKDK